MPGCAGAQRRPDAGTVSGDQAKAVYQAVLWNLTVLGEAANYLPESMIETRLDIPWSAIIGMRNRLVHGYGSIDPRIVWEVVESAIPTLIPQLEGLLAVAMEEYADD